MNYQELLAWANRPNEMAERMKKRQSLPQGFYRDEDGESFDIEDLTPLQRKARRATMEADLRD